MGTLSITDPVNGTANDATTIANANAAIKAVVNGNIDTVNLKDPGTGKVYGSTGAGSAAAVYPPGYQLDYVATTTSVSVTATTSATATTILTGTSQAYDGSAIIVTFYSPGLTIGTNTINVNLYDGSTELGILVSGNPGAASSSFRWPCCVSSPPFTPTVATHQYIIRAYVDAGTGTVGAGAGTLGLKYPAYLRITKV